MSRLTKLIAQAKAFRLGVGCTSCISLSTFARLLPFTPYSSPYFLGCSNDLYPPAISLAIQD